MKLSSVFLYYIQDIWILGSFLLYAPRKCFNLPSSRPFDMLLDENNFFRFEFILKKVCFWLFGFMVSELLTNPHSIAWDKLLIQYHLRGHDGWHWKARKLLKIYIFRFAVKTTFKKRFLIAVLIVFENLLNYFLISISNHCSVIEYRRIKRTFHFRYFYQRQLEMQTPWNAHFLLEEDTLNALNVLIPDMFQ